MKVIKMARTSNAFARVEPEIKEQAEQFDSEIEKGMADIQEGRVYTADDVEIEMKRNYGI